MPGLLLATILTPGMSVGHGPKVPSLAMVREGKDPRLLALAAFLGGVGWRGGGDDVDVPRAQRCFGVDGTPAKGGWVVEVAEHEQVVGQEQRLVQDQHRSVRTCPALWGIGNGLAPAAGCVEAFDDPAPPSRLLLTEVSPAGGQARQVVMGQWAALVETGELQDGFHSRGDLRLRGEDCPAIGA